MWKFVHYSPHRFNESFGSLLFRSRKPPLKRRSDPQPCFRREYLLFSIFQGYVVSRSSCCLLASLSGYPNYFCQKYLCGFTLVSTNIYCRNNTVFLHKYVQVSMYSYIVFVTLWKQFSFLCLHMYIHMYVCMYVQSLVVVVDAVSLRLSLVC